MIRTARRASDKNKGALGKYGGQRNAECYRCVLSDLKDLFDGDHVKFFDGPPESSKLKAGELGVNLDLFRQVKEFYFKAKLNIPCRVLADICQDIQDHGYIGRMDDSAERLDTAPSTVHRWRTRFVESGILKRYNQNGRYSVDSGVAIRKSRDGKVIKPTAEAKANFRF